MYKIKPFLIYDIEVGTVFQNSTSTALVKNKKLINFLKDLEINKKNTITENELKNYFPNNFEETLHFILTNNIIYRKIEPIFSFNDLYIYTNCNVFKEVSQFFIKDLDSFGKIEFHNLEKSYSLPKEDDLCIIFLNPFELVEFEKIVNKFKEIDCVVKYIFYYNHSIYISNFHKPSWKNPCPKCFFYSLESQLRSFGNINENLNFQTLVDMFSVKEAKFKSWFLPKPYNFISVFDVLFNQFKSLSDFNSIVNLVHEISIETTYINTDFCYPWDMCDCYE